MRPRVGIVGETICQLNGGLSVGSRSREKFRVRSRIYGTSDTPPSSAYTLPMFLGIDIDLFCFV
jgi:hypothetical protein